MCGEKVQDSGEKVQDSGEKVQDTPFKLPILDYLKRL